MREVEVGRWCLILRFEWEWLWRILWQQESHSIWIFRQHLGYQSESTLSLGVQYICFGGKLFLAPNHPFSIWCACSAILLVLWFSTTITKLSIYLFKLSFAAEKASSVEIWIYFEQKVWSSPLFWRYIFDNQPPIPNLSRTFPVTCDSFMTEKIRDTVFYSLIALVVTAM